MRRIVYVAVFSALSSALSVETRQSTRKGLYFS